MSVIGRVAPFVVGAGPTGPTYRYLRLMFPAPGGTFPSVTEVYWNASGTDYPTVAMTTASAPSPLVVSTIATNSGQGYFAFDKSTASTLEFDPPNLGDGSVTLDLGSGNGIAPTSIGIVTNNTTGMGSFLCYGSNNATFTTGQVLLYSSGSVGSGWTAGVRRDFTF